MPTYLRRTLIAGTCLTIGAVPALAQDDQPEIETDPFALAITAERYGVLIDRAREGAIEGQPAMTLDDEITTERAATALRRAVFDLYQLQAITCDFQLVGPDDCGAIAPPEWLGEAPGSTPTPEQIHERIDWLTAHMDPYVEAGCDAGESRRTDEDGLPHYCSVE